MLSKHDELSYRVVYCIPLFMFYSLMKIILNKARPEVIKINDINKRDRPCIYKMFNYGLGICFENGRGRN